MRFLEFARQQGDALLVILLGRRWLEEGVKEKFYRTEERARGVASVEYVDKVFVMDDLTIEQVLEIAKPQIYVMGEEFSHKTDTVAKEIEIIEAGGGKTVFSSGEVRYASTELLHKDIIEIKQERKHLFHKALSKQSIDIRKLLGSFEDFRKISILVIGDSIIDRYVACDALGMSSEAPVLVVNELEHKDFIGGAAIVATHLHGLGARASFVSVTGSDEPAAFLRERLDREGIKNRLIVDETRPTTFKIRYMVGQQKILRVSRLKDKHLNARMEEEVMRFIDEMGPCLDGIIVSDFSYGMITPRLADHISLVASRHNLKLFGDSQISSQMGNVAKFNNYYLLTPTEKEARLAIDDKYSGLEFVGNELLRRTQSRNIVLTLGENGFIAFEGGGGNPYVRTQHFPALNSSPADVMGAGDSLLTALAVSSCAGLNLMEASAVGTVVASLAVGRVGNVPVNIEEVRECLKSI
jgi:rfaE bifunctional protein kinase chain/domain